jgi:hypothetical protein
MHRAAGEAAARRSPAVETAASETPCPPARTARATGRTLPRRQPAATTIRRPSTRHCARMRHERSAKADITLPLPRIHSPGRGMRRARQITPPLPTSTPTGLSPHRSRIRRFRPVVRNRGRRTL